MEEQRKQIIENIKIIRNKKDATECKLILSRICPHIIMDKYRFNQKSRDRNTGNRESSSNGYMNKRMNDPDSLNKRMNNRDKLNSLNGPDSSNDLDNRDSSNGLNSPNDKNIPDSDSPNDKEICNKSSQFACPSDKDNTSLSDSSTCPDASLSDSSMYPLSVAPIEEALLYPNEMSRSVLYGIVGAIREEIGVEELFYMHRILSNALVSSGKFGYSAEYDRWLVLSVIKISEISKDEKYSLLYFPVVTDRLRMSGCFRERGILLSDYLTNNEILHNSPESVYFHGDIPLKPIIEEDDDSAEESDESDNEITSIAEYLSLMKDHSTDSSRSNRLTNQLILLLPQESEKNKKKYGRQLVKVLLNLQTKEGTDAVCTLLSVESVLLEVVPLIYNREKNSFYFRKTLVACLINVSGSIRRDLSMHIVERYFSREFSKEDSLLGVDLLVRYLSTR